MWPRSRRGAKKMRTPRWTDEQRGKPFCQNTQVSEEGEGEAVVGVSEVAEL